MPTTFLDLIAANKRNSAILVACFILFTLIVALVFALAIMIQISPDAALQVNLWRSLIVGGIAAGIAGLMAFVSYYQGDKMILAVSGAKPLEKKDDPQLYNVVEELAIAAGLPQTGHLK